MMYFEYNLQPVLIENIAIENQDQITCILLLLFFEKIQIAVWRDFLLSTKIFQNKEN